MIEKSVEGQDFVWRSYASATEGNFQNYDVFLFKIRYISIWGGRGQKRPKKVRCLLWTAPYTFRETTCVFQFFINFDTN